MNPLLVHGLTALALVSVSGCASFQSDDGARYALGRQHKVVLVQIPLSRDERLLREQFAGNLPDESAQSSEAIAKAVANAERYALGEMRKALEHQPELTIDDSDRSVQAVEQLGLTNPALAITSDIAQRLHTMTGAEDLVRFRITDYGVTPKAWRTAYITFEVVSTLAIAGIAYAYPKTRALAGAYLVEEGIEEALEGYAGFWALNEVGRPVRVEGELTSLTDGTEVWKGAATGLSDIRLARIIRKVSPEEQDSQRQRATQHAVGRLSAKLIDGLIHSESGASP